MYVCMYVYMHMYVCIYTNPPTEETFFITTWPILNLENAVYVSARCFAEKCLHRIVRTQQATQRHEKISFLNRICGS